MDDEEYRMKLIGAGVRPAYVATVNGPDLDRIGDLVEVPRPLAPHSGIVEMPSPLALVAAGALWAAVLLVVAWLAGLI